MYFFLQEDSLKILLFKKIEINKIDKMSLVTNLFLLDNQLIFKYNGKLYPSSSEIFRKVKSGIKIEHVRDFEIDPNGSKLIVFLLKEKDTEKISLLIVQDRSDGTTKIVSPASFDYTKGYYSIHFEILSSPEFNLKEFSENRYETLRMLDEDYTHILKVDKKPLLDKQFIDELLNQREDKFLPGNDKFQPSQQPSIGGFQPSQPTI